MIDKNGYGIRDTKLSTLNIKFTNGRFIDKLSNTNL